MGHTTAAAKSAVVFTCPTAATLSVALSILGALSDSSVWPVCE